MKILSRSSSLQDAIDVAISMLDLYVGISDKKIFFIAYEKRIVVVLPKYSILYKNLGISLSEALGSFGVLPKNQILYLDEMLKRDSNNLIKKSKLVQRNYWLLEK